MVIISKLQNNQMKPRPRIWCQQDFSQLYEQQPKIQNALTYRTVALQIESSHIKVKIPSNASEQFYRFLLYKAAYYFYLNQKCTNPLYQTASISFFQQVQGYQMWYGLWKGQFSEGKKSAIFKCVRYNNNESIHNYLPMAVIEEGFGYCKILCRNKRDGKYYNIVEYKNIAENQNKLLILQQGNKYIQHPFIVSLHEIIKTQANTYLIYDHAPYKLEQFLSIPSQLDSQLQLSRDQKSISSFFSFKLTEEQIYTYFCQLVLALVYLQQSQINDIRIGFDVIDIGLDGHLVLNQQIFQSQKSMPNYTQRSKYKIHFLYEFFNTLVACSNIMDCMPLNLYEEYTKFGMFLIQVSQKKKPSIRQIINHPWFQVKSSQQLLSKSCTALDPKNFISKSQSVTQNYRSLTKEEISNFFAEYQKSKKLRYESFKITGLTQNQKILRKYGQTQETQDQNPSQINYWDLCKKRVMKIDSILPRNSFKRTIAQGQDSLSSKSSTFHKSPYLTAIKKQRLNRQKAYFKNQ